MVLVGAKGQWCEAGELWGSGGEQKAPARLDEDRAAALGVLEPLQRGWLRSSAVRTSGADTPAAPRLPAFVSAMEGEPVSRGTRMEPWKPESSEGVLRQSEAGGPCVRVTQVTRSCSWS